MTTRTKPKTKTKQYANMDSIKDTSTKHRTQPRTPSMQDLYNRHHTALTSVTENLSNRLDTLRARIECNAVDQDKKMRAISSELGLLGLQNLTLALQCSRLRRALRKHGYTQVQITAIEDGR